ncbi:MAG: sialidase family protein [Telluria sp.]
MEFHERKDCCDELARLIRIQLELNAAGNATLARISSQLDTALCILEHISKNSCELVNEVHGHAHLHAGARAVGEALLGMYKAAHPEAALAYDGVEQMRRQMLACCPTPAPEPPVCVYEPCPRSEPESGFAVAGLGQAFPSRVIGAPFPPSGPNDQQHEPNEAPGRDSPVGPFRGFVAPGSGLKVQDFANGPGGGGDDPVVFGTYTNYGDKATPKSTVAADISGAEAGNVVMASGNWYAMYSTDGGATFTSIDPTTIFPNTADGGFCCDQVLQYAPSVDRFIWLMQFQPGADGNSRLRIAAASPQDVINSKATAWTYWDLTNAGLGVAAVKDTTGPLDYPDMALGDNHLYLSVDARASGNGTGLVVVRVPLNEIQAGGTINYRYTHPGDSLSAFGAHITQNTGDEVFWAGTGSPKDNGTLQVFSWKADSDTYFWRDVALKYNWANGAISSVAKDGNDWLNKLNGFPKFAAIGATRRGNEVWFAWTASAGDGGHGGFDFPNPHVQVVQIDVKNNYKLLGHFPIWNPDYAFAYPSLATNDRGEVGIALGWGGLQNYAQAAVGILGDFVVWYPEASTAATTRWGDYVTVRQASPQTGMFAGFGYAIIKDSSTAGVHFDPYYILFGRQSVVNPGGGIG